MVLVGDLTLCECVRFEVKWRREREGGREGGRMGYWTVKRDVFIVWIETKTLDDA